MDVVFPVTFCKRANKPSQCTQTKYSKSDLIIKFSGGEGTKESPYILSTLTDLKQLADSVSFGKSPDERNNWSFNKYFVLSNDITDDSLRIPIGTLSRPFQGNFDGKGFNISLAIDSESDYTGLFGYLLHANIQQVVVRGMLSGINT
jgi:hypothetical protein